MSYDVAVIGLGVMGSAAAWRLARRGLKVVGLEQFAPAHDRGSSHGKSRVIRQAYFEHPDYVPLVLRAYELWRELEKETGRELLLKTGGLMIGPPESPIVRGSLESARVHSIPHRLLAAEDLRRRFPFMRFGERDVAVEEFEAGVLFPEEAVLAFQERARALGAELRFGVKAAIGDPAAPKVVVTAGPWAGEFAPALPLRVERLVMFWFDPVSDGGRIPLFIWDYEGRPFYAVPDVRGHGVKTGFYHTGVFASPDGVRREVREDEVAEIRSVLARAIPALDGKLRATAVCLYTNTPDAHFAIGALPGRPDVVIASPCSGHGFKFAPVIGEILADLSAEGRTRHPVGLFALDRLAGPR